MERSRSNSGCVIKFDANVERIITPYEERIQFEACVWPVARFVRRDLNRLMVQLFFAWKSRKGRAILRDQIWAVSIEARRLEDKALRYEFPPDELNDTIPLRLVSEECREIVDALLTADRALFKLINALGIEVCDEHGFHFFKALRTVKKSCEAIIEEIRENKIRNSHANNQAPPYV